MLHSRYVVYPIRALETCVYTKGACALVFASEDMAQRIKERTNREPIWIKGVGAATEPYFVGNDITRYKVLHRITSDYLATVEYIPMNPGRRGLVNRAEAWKGSSVRE